MLVEAVFCDSFIYLYVFCQRNNPGGEIVLTTSLRSDRQESILCYVKDLINS